MRPWGTAASMRPRRARRNTRTAAAAAGPLTPSSPLLFALCLLPFAFCLSALPVGCATEDPLSPTRRPLIAGNWKMNAGGHDARPLAAAVARAAADAEHVDVLVAPPFTALATVAEELDARESRVSVAAQNMSAEASGAFTGEVSSGMIRDAGATWVILGHSERRQLFGETDAIVARKAAAAMTGGPRPIVCVGETLAEREAGATL